MTPPSGPMYPAAFEFPLQLHVAAVVIAVESVVLRALLSAR
ncbi:MAG: hypothetical protein RIQ71_2706 [Verrucomicrobiota bacterium]|jgi:hypothetical protein